MEFEEINWTIDKLIEKLEDERLNYGGDMKVLVSDGRRLVANDYGFYHRIIEKKDYLVLIPLGEFDYRGKV